MRVSVVVSNKSKNVFFIYIKIIKLYFVIRLFFDTKILGNFYKAFGLVVR